MDGCSSSVQGQAREAALVVDAYGGAVLHRPLDVVDADVVPEDGARVRVLQLDGRAREADEGGVRQGVAHVAGEAVDELVLAAVGLVGDDDDVAPVREQRVAVAPLVGEELLDGREHDAARLDGELAAQVGAALRLGRRLTQKVLAAGESCRRAGRRGRCGR